jgi:Na+-translocating ferredoxin:NAD+ oxidoreductase subunit B
LNSIDPAYRDLALLLDTLPQGYPATESGIELELLGKLFSPEEARMAARLSLTAETPAAISARAGLDEGAVRACLKSMVKQGLIEFEKAAGA